MCIDCNVNEGNKGKEGKVIYAGIEGQCRNLMIAGSLQ